MKQRVEFIDLAKGICMLLIVAHHILPFAKIAEIGLLGNSFYFILSGLFFKTYDSFFTYIKKKINNILIPFVFFYVVGYALFYLIKAVAPEIPTANASGILDIFTQRNLFNGPIWFLMSLFWVSICFYAIHRISRHESIRAILVLFIGILGAVLLRYHIFAPMFLDVAMRALPMFYIGFLLKKTSLLYPPPSDKLDKYNLLLAIGLALLSIGWSFLTHAPVPLVATTWLDGISGYISLVSGIVAVLLLCKFIKNCSPISYIGRYSIIVLCTHHLIYRPILFVLTRISSDYVLVSWLVFIATIIVTYLIIPLCIKYLPYVTAQKDVFLIKR